MTPQHLIVGAGPVGAAVAQLLVQRGHRVQLVTGSGSAIGPEHPQIERIRVQGPRTDRLADLARGCSAIYNCAHHEHAEWDSDLPTLAASLLAAAQTSGAVLATVSDLSAYGRSPGAMSSSTPLAPIDQRGQMRARIWHEALSAHENGRARIVEVRTSDVADAGGNSYVARNAQAVMAGKRAFVMGSPDQAHSWTAVADVGRLLVGAVFDPTAHGQAWLVPTAAPRTQRQALRDVAAIAEAPAPRISSLGPLALQAAGVFSPRVRDLAAAAYRFTGPFVVDDSATRAHFGMQSRPWRETVERIVVSAWANGGRSAPAG